MIEKHPATSEVAAAAGLVTFINPPRDGQTMTRAEAIVFAAKIMLVIGAPIDDLIATIEAMKRASQG